MNKARLVTEINPQFCRPSSKLIHYIVHRGESLAGLTNRSVQCEWWMMLFPSCVHFSSFSPASSLLPTVSCQASCKRITWHNVQCLGIYNYAFHLSVNVDYWFFFFSINSVGIYHGLWLLPARRYASAVLAMSVCLSQQQQQQPFNGRLSGTTRVGRYQKKTFTRSHPSWSTYFLYHLFLSVCHK